MVTVRTASARLLAAPVVPLLGAAGFLARGGILLFSVPFWTIPSPVGFTLLIPPDAIGAAGASPRLLALAGAVAAVVLVGILGAMVAGALCEIALHERLAGGPEPGGLRDSAGRSRGRLAAGLLVIEAVALLPVVLALAVAIQRLVEVGRAEFLAPGDLALPFAVRVATAAWPQLAVVGATVLLADLLYGTAARWFLARSRGGGVDAPGTRPAQRRIASVARRGAAWLECWVVTIVTVIPGLALALAAWRLVGLAAYGSLALTAGPTALALSVVVFVLSWCAAVGLAGAGSVVRGVLVSLAARS